MAPTWTDNRGNGSLLNKLMTTKFPACALLMELACFNRLANGNSEDFTPSKEIKVDVEATRWEVLPDSLWMARDADSQFQSKKLHSELPRRDQRQRKRKLEETNSW